MRPSESGTQEPISGHHTEQASGGNPGRGELRLVVADSFEELSRHADAWDRLYELSVSRVHTLSHAWVSSFLENQCCPDESWLCVFAYDGEQLVGVLPVIAKEGRTLGMPCTTLSTPGNPDSVSIDILCRPEFEHSAIPYMLDSLRQFFPHWFKLCMTRLSQLSPTLKVATEGHHSYLWYRDLNGRGCLVYSEGDFEEYLKSLKDKFARNLRRVGRKFDALPESKAEFLAGNEATAKYLEDFVEIEAAGWKGRQGTAIKQNEGQLAFYRSLVQRLAARGWLEWHLLKAEDKIIAIHMAVRAGSALVLLKIAFDEKFSSVAPGNILMERTIKRAFEAEDISEVNCLTDMAWNQNWNMPCRTYYDLTLWPKRSLSFAAGYLPARMREVVRDLPGARPAYHRIKKLLGGAEQT